jgi:hypothetical protein
MKFSEKIRTVLKANKLDINSPSALEDFIGAGQGAITGADQTKGPGLKTQKKIVDKLRINQRWWDTGEGEIFLPATVPRLSFDGSAEDQIKKGMLEQLYKDLDNQARHLDKALDLVARLLPPGKGVERVMTKD